MPAGWGEGRLSSVSDDTGSGEVAQSLPRDVSFSDSLRGHPLQPSLLTDDSAHVLLFPQDMLVKKMRHEDRRMALPLWPLVFSLWPSFLSRLLSDLSLSGMQGDSRSLRPSVHPALCAGPGTSPVSPSFFSGVFQTDVACEFSSHL